MHCIDDQDVSYINIRNICNIASQFYTVFSGGVSRKKSQMAYRPVYFNLLNIGKEDMEMCIFHEKAISLKLRKECYYGTDN